MAGSCALWELQVRRGFSQRHDPAAPSRRELEERFLGICRDAGLPPDADDAWIPYPGGSGAEADFVRREQRLIVEVDGRAARTARDTRSNTTADAVSA
jgi:hypothetical protein